MTALGRNFVWSALLAAATQGCGQQGPLVLPESAQPIERLEAPPTVEQPAAEDEQQDER